MSGMTVVIIAGGDIDDSAVSLFCPGGSIYIIAVDRGYESALKMGIIPDLILGDMDSVSPEKLHSARDQGIQIREFPAEKDESDLELAIDESIRMNPDRIVILGATGGRMDHTLFNILLLLKYDNINITIKSIREEIFLADKKTEINAPIGTTVSLVPLTTEIKGIVAEGFKYPLKGESLYMASSRGLSNILTGGRGTVSFEEGKLLVIINKTEVL